MQVLQIVCCIFVVVYRVGAAAGRVNWLRVVRGSV